MQGHSANHKYMPRVVVKQTPAHGGTSITWPVQRGKSERGHQRKIKNIYTQKREHSVTDFGSRTESWF